MWSRGQRKASALIAAGAALAVTLAACSSTPPRPKPTPTARPGATAVIASAAPALNLAAGAIPWAALPKSGAAIDPSASPVPSPPIPIPPGTPSCRAAQLDGAFGGAEGATGNTDLPIALRNHSQTACTLDGFAYVTVLNSSGAVLMPASADPEQQGTFFADWPVVPVLMQVGTPAFPASPGAGEEVQLSRGQAVMNLSWYDCSQPAASRLWLDLPHGGGRLVVPFAVRGSYSPACDGNHPPPQLSRGPLSPATFPWPPDIHYLQVTTSITAPSSVRRGSVLQFEVTLYNQDTAAYALSPCPDYSMWLGDKLGYTQWQLNCRPVGSIAPGAQAVFLMEYDVPGDAPLGAAALQWTLLDGRVAQPAGSTAALTVTG